ncbi:MAG: LuxR C-terminal-related transcriptional regulator [Micropepsaceae bacterium]
MALIDDLAGHIDAFARTDDPQAAAVSFADTLKPYGLTGLGTRVYQMPEGPIDSDSIWKAGGGVATIWPADWAGTPGFRYICFTENPMLGALRERRGYFLYSDLAPRERHGTYWEAFSEGGINEGMGVVVYGRGRQVSSLAMTFERLELSPMEKTVVRAAGLTLAERTALLCGTPPATAPKLTGREYDCLAYVAAGKSDWEISVILNLSQATVRFHVDNARRKLDATTRTHAVARAAAAGLI